METRGDIYVDLDDVLCETARACLAISEREFGKCVAYERLTTFELGAACGLDAAETAELYRIIHRPEELLKLEPVSAAMPILKRWAGSGFQIAIVTGRPPETTDASREWLARAEVPYHSFTVVDKYRRFTAGNASHAPLSTLAERRFCFAVEDSPTMARFLAEQMRVAVKLLDRPWNRAEAAHPQITRHIHWEELSMLVP